MNENNESDGTNNSIILKCRICFHKKDRMHSIFKRRNGASAFDKLLMNTKLLIDRNDGGPTLICIQCLIDLEITDSFLKKCEKSNEILASYNFAFPGRQEVLQDLDDNWYFNNSLSSELALVNPKDLILEREKCRDFRVVKSRENPKNKFQCNLCKKWFAKKENLRVHLLRHTTEYKFSCQKCGYRSHTHSELRSHSKTHMPCTKFHKCLLCSKKFTSSSNLKIHMRRHTGERPAECQVCKKTFISQSTLRVHKRVHTGEKPYMCTICGRQFASNKMSRHMRAHEPPPKPQPGPRSSAATRSIQCPHRGCPKRYSHRQSLNKHLKCHHKNKQRILEPASARGTEGYQKSNRQTNKLDDTEII